jgi:outer membrane protein assembly factor BamB
MSTIRNLARRSLLTAPLALGGCGLFDHWFGENKVPLPGTRITVMRPRTELEVDAAGARVVLPPPAANAEWPQPGGNPAHAMGHLQVRDALAPAWRSDIGAAAGFRARISAQPVVAGGRVFAMDSDAVVTAYDAATGGRVWRLDTEDKDNRSTNLGGGVAVDGGTLYASTGLAELLAVEAATGKVLWRQNLGSPARSAPTIADGRIFVLTLDNQLLTMAADDGRRLWNFQASTPDTAVFGLPAAAYADGLVVAGFGSGELVAMRAATGSVAWSDSLASTGGRISLTDLSAIRGLPVISAGRVYVGGLGGLVLSLDLRTGRRLWEREIATGDTLWVAGDWVFLLTTDFRTAALRQNDGGVAWVTQLPQWENEKDKEDPILWIGPVLAGDRLIFASSNAQALAVSPYNGNILGQQAISGAASVPASVADGTVFLVTDDATLAALR